MDIAMKDVAKLSKDLYYNESKQYGEVSGDKVFRNLINDALGQEQGTKKIDYYAWQEHKNKVFQIISVAVDEVLPTILTDQLDSLAEVRNVGLGDEVVFSFEDDSLFRVGLVASGTRDLRRQELHGGSYTVETDWYGAKLFTELERFLAGHVNWRAWIDRIAKSFANQLQVMIADAFMGSYDDLRAARKHAGAFSTEELGEIARHVQVASGNKPVAVYGTRTALAQISEHAYESEGMKDAMNNVGYVGSVAGLDLVALPDAYKAGTEEFALDSNTLLVLPQNEKLVSIVLEGQPLMKEADGGNRNDMQIEFEYLKKLGVQVAQSSVYGMYRLG